MESTKQTNKEYLSDVKDWAVQVQTMLAELELDTDLYKEWNEEILNLIMEIDEHLKEERSMVAINNVRSIESKVKDLYKKSVDLIENSTNNAEQNFDNHNLVPIGEHKLPPLPYDYTALEPYIDERIMKLHHDEHHKSYVDGLNNAEKNMEIARKTGDFKLLKHWEREAAFHGSGHYLHTIFWENMSPNGGGKPTGTLLNKINESFGSYSAFKKHFSEAAKNVEGVGWALLVWSPRSHRLEILQSEKHQLFTQWDTIPLLVLDVWEHAYYLQYENNRDKYIENWWNIVNWKNVDKRLREAIKLKWKSF